MPLMRVPLAVFLTPFVTAGLPVSACGQAMVGYGLGVGRSGVSGAAAGKVGKSTGAVFDRTAGALQKAGKAGDSQPAGSAPASAKAPSSQDAQKDPAPQAETPALDPSAIPIGLERQDLLSQVGKPSMKMTSMDGSAVVEKLWFRAAGRETVVVTLRDGKVSAVSSSSAN